MKGTEKQIKWAEDIMNNALNTVNANIEHSKTSDALLTRLQVYEEIKKMLEESFSQVTEASQLINARDRFDPRRINNIAQQRENQIRAGK